MTRKRRGRVTLKAYKRSLPVPNAWAATFGRPVWTDQESALCEEPAPLPSREDVERLFSDDR